MSLTTHISRVAVALRATGSFVPEFPGKGRTKTVAAARWAAGSLRSATTNQAALNYRAPHRLTSAVPSVPSVP
jgi:hypothetical protein